MLASIPTGFPRRIPQAVILDDTLKQTRQALATGIVPHSQQAQWEALLAQATEDLADLEESTVDRAAKLCIPPPRPIPEELAARVPLPPIQFQQRLQPSRTDLNFFPGQFVAVCPGFGEPSNDRNQF